MPLSARQEYNLWHIMTGDIPAAAVIDWTGITSLDRMEQQEALRRAPYTTVRQRVLGSQSAYFEPQNEMIHSLPGDINQKIDKQRLIINSFYNSIHEGMWEGAKALAEDYKDEFPGLKKIYETEYRKAHPRPDSTLQQIDPMLAVMRGAGLDISNAYYQTPADRREYLKYIEKTAKNEAELDYYYFLYYMYLQGCLYFVNLQKQLLEQGINSISADDLDKVMRALYANRKEAFHWESSGATSFKELYDKETDKVAYTAGGSLGALRDKVPEQAYKALKDAGIISSDMVDSGYWSPYLLPSGHWILKGNNGEFIDPLSGRIDEKGSDEYTQAGLTNNWSVKSAHRRYTQPSASDMLKSAGQHKSSLLNSNKKPIFGSSSFFQGGRR